MADIRQALFSKPLPYDEATQYAERQVETAPLGEQAKAAAQFTWESLPGVGTYYTVEDIKDELRQEEPNYLKIGALAGTEVIGLIPGLGSAAKNMIRKGAKARQTDNSVDVASNIPSVPKNKPEEFSGTLPTRHGYTGDRPTEFLSRGEYKGERYDGTGGVFGDKPLYLEDPENPFFLTDDGVVAFSYDDVTDVDASFDKAFVLTPETVSTLKSKVGDVDLLDEASGPLVVDKLEELGYDGLIIRGFPDPKTTDLGRLRAEQTSALSGVGTDFEKGRDITDSYASKIQAAREAEGIDETLQQSQVLAFRPERQKVLDPASKVAKEPFKKTRPAYKLFVKSEDEKLYPLFVNASDEIPVNEWLEADFPDVAFKGKTQKGGEGWYVPTKGAKRDPDRFFLDGEEITKKEYNKLGPNSKPYATIVRGEQAKATGDRIVIPDEETRQKLIDAGFITEKTGRTKDAPYGKVTAVAARPGYHASVNPVAEHLGPQDIKVTKDEVAKLLDAGVNPKAIRSRGDQYYVKRRAEDQYWAEVEMADDTSDELRAYMESQGRTDINDKVPKGGSYSYVDGQADGDTWVVGGDMKVKKVLTREEAKAAQEAAGVKDLPYRDEVEAILGRKFAEGGLVGEDMYTGQQDYLLAASSGEEMSEGGSVEKQTEAVFKSSRGYAEGGEVGAAPDTTIGVDPVSGNEIPMGSTAAEVRDDIPAQLSEGEYVVPADVVRFYGVKFFEDLRTGAKQGFMEMAENGRIGGEPVETDGMEIIEPEDDLPFDISELQMMDDDEVEMDEGGYLSKARSRAEQDKPINRFEQFLQWLLKDEDEYGENPIDRYAKEQEDKGIDWNFMGNAYERGQRKFNAGGFAPGVMFNPVGSGGMSGGFEIKEYVGPNGDSLFIQFMNGRPMSYIPEGYKPKGTTQEQAATGTVDTGSVQTGTSTNIASGGSDDSPMSKTEAQQFVDEYQISGKDYASMNTEGLQSNIDSLGKGSKLMSTAAGLLGGPIIGTAASLGVGSANRNEAYNILDGIAYQLEQNPDEAQKATLLKQQEQVQAYLKPEEKDSGIATSLLKGSGVFGGASSLYDQLGDYGGAVDTDIDGDRVVVGDGRVTFGDTWLGDLLGADGMAGVQGPGLSESMAGARRTAPDWEDEGSAEKGSGQIQEKQTYAQQIENNPDLSQKERNSIQQSATNDWVKATDAVNQLSKGDDHIAFHKAIRAQSEASRQATAAIQANTRARNNDDDPSNDSPVSGNGACFLTTAIVDRRGEADDGPTLTKLRKFRDTYLRNMPTEVEKYYEVAPRIVAAIPDNHNDWLWVGEQIDKSVAYIDAGLEDKAYGTYKAMVKRLESDWL